MRFHWLRFAATCALGLAAAPAAAQDDEDDKIALGQVPHVVLQAAERAAPEARFTHAYKEVEDGRALYEVCGQDGEGRPVEIEISARGVVRGVETAVTVDQVPKAVIDALRMKTRGLKLNKAEVITRTNRVIGYEFEGKNAEGDDVEVTVSPDGRTVNVEVLDDE